MAIDFEIDEREGEPMTDGQAEDLAEREVDIEDEQELDASQVDENAANLVPFYQQSEDGKKFLETLAKQVVEDFERAWDSGDEYRGRREEDYRVLTGYLQKKSFPFDGCANAHAPLMLERLLRLSSTLFAEIFTNHDRIFDVAPTGPDDNFVTEILSRHGDWQFKNVLTDFLRQQHRGLQEFVAVGSVFAHSYYDGLRNRHDILTCEEFVIPYVWTTVETDLSDVPYKVKVLRKYRHELEALAEDGEWVGIEDVIEGEPPPQHEEPDTVVRQTVAQHEGIQPADDDPSAPYKFYQYVGWAKLPGGKRQRPIEAIVDAKTHTVCKLFVAEVEDWRDRARYDREMQEWMAWQANMAAFQQVQAQEQQVRQRLGMPDVEAMERDMLMAQLDAEPMQPPPPPPWMKSEEQQLRGPAPVKKKPINMFSHGVCIENPMGSMGLSYGAILADENRMADEALNRFYDAATLANCFSLLIPENLNIEAGSIPFGPGKITRVRGVTGDQLRSSLVELRPSPANTQLVDLARMAHEWGDGVTVSGIVSGEPGKSGETYRGVATRLERATKQLSVAGLKYLDFLGQIIKNNAYLNSVYLPDNEIVDVVNDLGITDQASVTKEMYRRDYRVTFTADVRFASQAQKIAEADEIVQMVQAIPPLQSNSAFVYAALKEVLQARGKHDLVPLLGPPPPPPQGPLNTAPPPPPAGPGGPGGPGGPPPGPQAPAIPTGAAPGGVPGPKPGPEVQS